MKSTEALQKIFYRPSEVFEELREQRSWLPAAFVLLVVVVVHSSLVNYSISRAYAQHEPSEADRERFEALIEEYREEIEAAQESARGGIVDVNGWAGSGAETEVFFVTSPGLDTTLYNAVIAAFALLIALAIEVAYFRFVGSKMQLSFRTADWVAFTVWSRIPGLVLAFLGVLLVLLISGYQANVVNYESLSIARWVPLPLRPDRGVNILNIDIYHLDAALIWVIALQTLGFQIWSRRSFIISFAVVTTPTVILYGLVLWLSTDGLFWYLAFR